MKKVNNKKFKFRKFCKQIKIKFKFFLSILGEISMQKVKVHRYVSGKIPEYARNISSEESSDDEDFIEKEKSNKNKPEDEQQQHPVRER